MQINFIKGHISLLRMKSAVILILATMTGFSSHAEDKQKSLETDTKASSWQLENASKSPKRSAVPDMLFKLGSPKKTVPVIEIPKVFPDITNMNKLGESSQ